MQNHWLVFTADDTFGVESSADNDCYDWIEVSGADNHTSGQ